MKEGNENESNDNCIFCKLANGEIPTATFVMKMKISA